MIAELPAKGSHLADLALWRDADGAIQLRVTHMEPRLIETTGDEVSDRMQIIAGWIEEAVQRMRETWR